MSNPYDDELSDRAADVAAKAQAKVYAAAKKKKPETDEERLERRRETQRAYYNRNKEARQAYARARSRRISATSRAQAEEQIHSLVDPDGLGEGTEQLASSLLAVTGMEGRAAPLVGWKKMYAAARGSVLKERIQKAVRAESRRRLMAGEDPEVPEDWIPELPPTTTQDT